MKESIKESLIAYVKTKYKAQPEHLLRSAFLISYEREPYGEKG